MAKFKVGDWIGIDIQKELPDCLWSNHIIRARLLRDAGPPPWKIEKIGPNLSNYVFSSEEDGFNIWVHGSIMSYKAIRFRHVYKSTDKKNQELLARSVEKEEFCLVSCPEI